MKVKDWIKMLEAMSPEVKERELAVWMPGSLINLSPMAPDGMTFPADHPRYGPYVLMEGNLASGSALESFL